MMFICNLSNVSLYPDDGQWDNRQEYMTLVLMTIKILFWIQMENRLCLHAYARIYMDKFMENCNNINEATLMIGVMIVYRR